MTNIGQNSSGLGFTVAGGEDVSKEKSCSLGLICPAIRHSCHISWKGDEWILDKGKDYLGATPSIDQKKSLQR